MATAAGARRRHMPRFFGHKAGVECPGARRQPLCRRGVDYLTVFAFSSENWKRPSEEVSGLMSLVLVAVSKYLPSSPAMACASGIIGDREAVSDKLRQAGNMPSI